MGLVLFARREKNQRIYALKTLLDWSLPAETLAGRAALFRKESLVWIALAKHKNTVQACWFDLDERYHPFLVMEYIEGDPRHGVSLRRWLSNVRTLQVPTAVRIILQALNGLIYARQTVNRELGLPFAHRDIKPENLLITRDGNIKVSDFGLVLAGEGFKAAGTPPYMPPEQWDGNSIEEKTDVYSLGCVFYELLQGHPPFGGSKEEIRKAHLRARPAPVAGAPDELKRIVMRCLAKSPDDRPGFSELMRKLQAVHATRTGNPLPLESEPEPLDAEDQNARGAAFDELGYFDKALECYGKAIVLDNGDPRYYLNRAATRIALQDLDGTLDDYARALEIKPDAVEIHLGMGSLYARMGDTMQALSCFDCATRLAPHKPETYVGLGNLFAQREFYQEAVQEFKKALSLRPSLAEAYLGLGNVHLCQNNYLEAEEMYEKAVHHNPLYGAAYLNLARLYQILGKRELRDKAMALAGLLMG